MESSSAQQRATASESASPVVVGGKLIGAAESSSPPHLRVSSPLPQRRVYVVASPERLEPPPQHQTLIAVAAAESSSTQHNQLGTAESSSPSHHRALVDATESSDLFAVAPEDSSPRLWFRRRNAPEDSAAPERLVETPEGSSTQQGTPRRRIRVRCRISHQRASCRELFVVALESSCRRKREFGPPRRRIRGLVAAPESTSPHHLRVHRRRCTRAHE